MDRFGRAQRRLKLACGALKLAENWTDIRAKAQSLCRFARINFFSRHCERSAPSQLKNIAYLSSRRTGQDARADYNGLTKEANRR
jgi:hypothetical protein